MPVTPYKSDLFQKCKETYQFLANCQQQAIQDQHSKIANLSFRLPSLAPWTVLERLSTPHQVHFYYDQATQQQSVVALNVAIAHSAEGPSRFARIQQFIKVWRKRVLSFNNRSISPDHPFLTPHFFCGFGFFDKLEAADPCFNAAQVFVPQVQIGTWQRQSIVSFNYLIDDDTHLNRLTEEIGQQLQRLVDFSQSADVTDWDMPKNMPFRRTAKIIKDVGDFRQSVKSALSQIQTLELHKVVLADAVEVLSVEPFNIPASLQVLRHQYPDCSVFAMGNGQGHTFMGASPERLLSIRQQTLITDGLAGSAPRGSTTIVDHQLAQQLLNSQKERYEHQIVVDFIVQQLRTLGLKSIYKTEPGLLQLSNIQHLHTPIQAPLPPHTEPLEILEKLHPTPAVAGLPRPDACELIQQLETFDRGLYAAPLGWVDTQGNSEFIVGIRSALINGRQARLYAGAGIVAGSDPNKELAEIKLKLQALLGSLI